jgi:translocation and assembly module TamB
LYSFDVQLDQIDAWILTPIIPDIFISTEGLASGTGRLWGTLDRFDFTSEFDVHSILAVPQFLKTNYYLDGKVYVSREGGVVLENINVRDNKGGTGVLDGTVSFNDFNPERPLNLRLSLNRLEFLNNTFEADVPFYGNVAGTGVVSLTGTNVSPFLRTTTPVTTTLDSRLAIPLLDEASVEEQSRFIEFVKSFSEIYEPKVETIDVVSDTNTERSFLEVFRLDLQFISPGSTVQLVFDPLTGEILNATGNGRIRITLEDQELQMFGNFNISGGDYTFVGGDIFVRRFQLRDGGSISWEGDPDNARLNITTAYRSRPNIGVLTSTFIDQQSRIPVDLILEITGTIQSLENTFYFEFPNAIDVSQNATELSLLNSEDQKLVQATSLLFTGGFIPVGTSADGQGELGSTLQARAGQVGLSQLLSNQINAILNNSLSILDVDFNLTGFDQADIGIALRLFDDRLILRGESQYNSDVTSGAETTLGDFGLTYRINRSLSLEVFHRRDPTLRSIVGNQSQAESINGVGLEAQFQFNTWKELRLRVWGQIRRLFGASDEDDQRTLTQ